MGIHACSGTTCPLGRQRGVRTGVGHEKTPNAGTRQGRQNRSGTPPRAHLHGAATAAGGADGESHADEGKTKTGCKGGQRYTTAGSCELPRKRVDTRRQHSQVATREARNWKREGCRADNGG